MIVEPGILALVSALLYGLGCWRFGSIFPFDEYSLYSDTAARSHSATPVFYADGHQANPWDFHQFAGFETASFLPSSIPTDVSWIAHETARWIQEHPLTGEPGPVEIEYGFIQYSLDQDGRILEERMIVCQGTAWAK